MSAATDEILEKLKSLTLLEASELVKQIEDTFDVSAADPAGGMMMMAPGAGGGGGFPVRRSPGVRYVARLRRPPGSRNRRGAGAHRACAQGAVRLSPASAVDPRPAPGPA